ncbi:hypothetical protein AC579_7244 [Pseudocercospora musae]|uniref:Uncharacterized protein n=1 Tax=Pseudocercospora musae TaxID=113226 RepID=A0A139IFF9_9PEZI|nr:hypothetical protein AC579_7244 [Pseudocercospora musae]
MALCSPWSSNIPVVRIEDEREVDYDVLKLSGKGLDAFAKLWNGILHDALLLVEAAAPGEAGCGS